MDTNQNTFEITALDGIVARIEGARWAGEWRDVPYSTLPPGARIRDRVQFTDGGLVLIAGTRDEQADRALVATFADGAVQAVAVALGIPKDEARQIMIGAF